MTKHRIHQAIREGDIFKKEGYTVRHNERGEGHPMLLDTRRRASWGTFEVHGAGEVPAVITGQRP